MDISASRSALAGADQKILILSDGDARAVMRHHANIISAGTAASLRHVTFTSIVDVEARSPFYDAPVYRDADRLEDRGIPTTIVRCGLYSDFILKHWLTPSPESEEVLLPTGQGCMAPISRDGVAAAIAAIASQPGEHHLRCVLTGHRALILDEIVTTFGKLAGQPIHRDTDIGDYLVWAWVRLNDPWSHAFSASCSSIADGRYSHVSVDFAELVGREPERLLEFPGHTLSAKPPDYR
jgi:NAD(P)H dehydrogenase (quinone)